MTALEILTAARAKVAQGWTQNVRARNLEGRVVQVDAPEAICWCSLGAMDVAGWAADVPLYQLAEAERVMRRALGTPYIATWNDAPGRTQAEVLDAFDRAIELAKEGR